MGSRSGGHFKIDREDIPEGTNSEYQGAEQEFGVQKDRKAVRRLKQWASGTPATRDAGGGKEMPVWELTGQGAGLAGGLDVDCGEKEDSRALVTG